MRLFVLLLLSFLVLTLNGQDEWDHAMVSEATRNYKNILKYTASDGSVWAVGDTVVFGNASGNGVFNHVSMGDGWVSVVQQAPAQWGGKQAEIKKIQVSGTRRTGRSLWLTCKGPMQPFHVNLEKAIETGEVETEGYTSDKALEELKKAKDKLDLGLISQEEFEKLRSELAKYID